MQAPTPGLPHKPWSKVGDVGDEFGEERVMSKVYERDDEAITRWEW